jgi:hypothetical protein
MTRATMKIRLCKAFAARQSLPHNLIRLCRSVR